MKGLSVVIPSLGEKKINKTLNSIFNSSIKPDEIILVLPSNKKSEINNKYNVKVFYSKVANQVAQRIIGFENCKYDYVIQLDDDIYLDNNCIKILLDFIKSQNKKTAAGPSLLNERNKQSVWMTDKIFKYKFFVNLLFYIINGKSGYVPGKISKAGLNMGFKDFKTASTPYEVDWLSGGCMIHKKNNLLLKNYYPYSGKSFAEDIIHCKKLKEKNTHLYHLPTAKCLHYETNKKTIYYKLIDIYKNFKTLKKINNNSFFDNIRLFIGTILYFMLLFFSRIFK